MSGKLYGIGVGPGDPELLTLKAVRIIKECQVIGVPVEEKEKSVAYQIVKQVVENLEEKTIIAIPMPMTKDQEKLKASHHAGAKVITECLDNHQNVAFLTLGDPTVYSTYLYLHKIVTDKGYDTEIVSGVPSFCAVAARLNEGLVEKSEMLHVIPSSYGIEEGLKLKGTKVLMKAGKKLKEVKEQLEKTDCKVSMIENCGMKDEKIYRTAEEINDKAGYYSLIIVKEK